MIEFDLPLEPRYSEIKAWYEKNREFFPKTIRGVYAYYPDVQFTVDAHFNFIEGKIKELGIEKAGKLKNMRFNKEMLMMLYHELKRTENWNLPMRSINELKSNQ